MLECGLEYRRNRAIPHQSGSPADRPGMFPRLFSDEDAAGKELMGQPPQFEADVLCRSWLGLFPVPKLVDVEPQAAHALETGGVARFCEVHRQCSNTDFGIGQFYQLR